MKGSSRPFQRGIGTIFTQEGLGTAKTWPVVSKSPVKGSRPCAVTAPPEVPFTASRNPGWAARDEGLSSSATRGRSGERNEEGRPQSTCKFTGYHRRSLRRGAWLKGSSHAGVRSRCNRYALQEECVRATYEYGRRQTVVAESDPAFAVMDGLEP